MKDGLPTSVLALMILLAVAIALTVVVVMEMDKPGDGPAKLGEEFKYDIEELGEIDPSLIEYEETDSISLDFGQVTAVAVDSNDRIYVGGDRVVRVFDPEGNRIAEVELTARPNCLVVGEDGTIYAGMRDHVEVYDADGELKAKWPEVEGDAFFTSIALWKDKVFVADFGNRFVVSYDTKGNPLRVIGRKDPDRNIPGFVIPSAHFDLAVTPDGLLRVANPGMHRIEAYTFDGDLEIHWGKASMGVEGFCGCCNPVDFAILPDGGFVTCEKGIRRVKVYDPRGEFVCVVAGPDAFAEEGKLDEAEQPGTRIKGSLDVATDSRGRIMVLDQRRRSVRIFEHKPE